MDRRTTLVVIATAALALGGVGAVASHAIVRGKQVSTMAANPGAVSIASPGTTFICSAERIGKRWVLTARHCTDLKPDRVYTNSLTRGQGSMAKVKRQINAPKGDMALLELASEPPGPIMPYSSVKPPAGAVLNMYGWGMTSASSQPSQTLKTATGTLKTTRSNPFYSSGLDLIIQGKSGSPWKGDSGGPVLYKGALVGSLSHSSSYGKNPTSECGYTAVYQNAAWIQKTTGIAPRNAGGSKPAPSGSSKPTPSGSATTTPKPKPKPSAPSTIPNRVVVNDSTINKVVAWSKTKPVILDIGAKWCGACKVLKPVMEKVNASSGGSWVLAMADADESPNIKSRYSASSLPTVVPLKGGKEVAGRFVGSRGESEIRNLVARLTKSSYDEYSSDGY